MLFGAAAPLLLPVIALPRGQAPAPKISPQDAEFFELKVRPLLAAKCFGCHGPKQQLGSLRLDSLLSMIKGNSGGPVIHPGDPDKSPLLQVLTYNGKTKMPPSGKLPQSEIDALTHWVKIGAPWPGQQVSEAARKAAATGEFVITPEQRKHWSFTPVRAAKPPVVKNRIWVRNFIDPFVLAKLEAQNLTPSPTADRRTLLRRAYLDVIGVPPSAEEVEAFLADRSPNAWEKVVDRLLADQRYGERWARHWLDVARYADTKGYVFTEDRNYPYAYTFRNWVIRSLNEDMPYDKFIQYQIAADKMVGDEDRHHLAAMGFLTVGRRFLNNQHDIIDDRIDTVMRGVVGLSVNCARCHDHKFDPIPTKDYYSLYGIFASSMEPNPALPIAPKSMTAKYDEAQNRLTDLKKQKDELVRRQVASLRTKIESDANSVPEPVRKVLMGIRVRTLPDEDQLKRIETSFSEDARQQLGSLRAQMNETQRSMPPAPELAMALVDAPNPVDPVVFVRGNPNNRGAGVPRRFIQIAWPREPEPIKQGSGRLELAQSLTSPENPLTARVIVNRVWTHHFGFGIVRTPSDFGTRGEQPTHPELLDTLASRFMQEGWSLKKLHRWILTSSTWMQASDLRPQVFVKDPENRLIWRQNRRRLDLEAMRDSMLLAAGALDTTPYGKSVDILTQPFSTRRSVYAFIERQNLPNFFRTFDLASPDVSTPQRFSTTVPTQALFLMNSPFVVEQAKRVAARPEISGRPVDAQLIRTLFRTVLGRSPSADETALVMGYLSAPSVPGASVWSYGYGGVDSSDRVVGFKELPHFTGSAWQGSAQLPDPKLEWKTLNVTGGHAGADQNNAVIRRFTSPVDGYVTISGRLAHDVMPGDGVRGRIVHSRLGVLGSWNVHNSETGTTVDRVELKKGDTLDFVVDCRTEQSHDSFRWAPVITLLPKGVRAADTSAEAAVWDAQKQFGGKGGADAGLNRLQSLAQTLLISNEFCFVD
jgi:mono/diheme cytochrome c family protein